MRRLTLWRLALLASTLAACGSSDVETGTIGPDAAAIVEPDALVYDGPCWPENTPPTPGLSVTLGTGFNEYKPMPDPLPLYYGAQAGFMFITYIKMSGFAPGNASNLLDPQNPRTRVRATFADTGIALTPPAAANACPNRYGYRPLAGTDEYEMVSQIPIIFDLCWRSDNLIGKQFRITVELQDYAGLTYAKDERIVTAAEPPPGEIWPMEMNSPGCP